MTNKQFNQVSTQARKKALQVLFVDESQIPGILAYIDDNPVGWCALSPRENYARLVKSRVIKPVDDKAVWSLVCFFVHKNYRKQGVTKSLLQASIKLAKERGAPALEAYPIDIRQSEKVEETSAYVGTVPMFKKAGFKKVANTKSKGAGKPRIIMRYIF
ncbi:MAG: GNAT family N-acetyltransferase [Candidatus Hodarchaeales archaeon]|jgi:GNAT superfamily N-acetyltransferase